MSNLLPRPALWRRVCHGPGLPIATAVALGALWTRHLLTVGLRISGDSAVFLHAATRLRFDGVWDAPPTRPPLYPSAVAAMMGWEPFAADAAALVAGLCLTLSLVGVGALAWRTTRHAPLSTGLVMVLAMWPAFTTVFEVAWTEGLAGFLLIGHLVALDHHLRTGRTPALHLAGLCLGLGALTRFLGMAAIGVFALALAARTLQDRQALRHRLVAVATAMSLPMGWMLWSHLARGSATGDRNPATTTWAHNLAALAEQCREALHTVPVLAVAGGLLCVAAVVHRQASSTESRAGMLDYTLLQLGVGLVAIVAATSRVAVDAIGPRYLAPAVPLVLIGSLFAWEALRPALEHKARSLVAHTAAIGVVLATILGLVSPLGQQLDVSLSQVEKPTGATFGGFAISPTQQILATRTAELLTEQAHGHLVVMSPSRSMWQWLAPTWRRATFAEVGSPVSGVRQTAAGWGVELALADGRVLSVLKADPHGTRQRVRARLRRALDATSSSAMVLVHDQTLGELAPDEGLAGLVDDGWAVDVVETAAPYTLFSVRPVTDALAVAAAAPLDAQPGDTPDAFAAPGRLGLGVGWRPTRKIFLDTMGRTDGALYIDARRDAVAMACGPDVAVSGGARVTGRVRTDGLPGKGFADVKLVFLDEDHKLMTPTGDRQAIQRISRTAGTTDWLHVDGTANLSGARFVRACVAVRGDRGRAWVDALDVHAVDTTVRAG